MLRRHQVLAGKKIVDRLLLVGLWLLAEHLFHVGLQIANNLAQSGVGFHRALFSMIAHSGKIQRLQIDPLRNSADLPRQPDLSRSSRYQIPIGPSSDDNGEYNNAVRLRGTTLSRAPGLSSLGRTNQHTLLEMKGKRAKKCSLAAFHG